MSHVMPMARLALREQEGRSPKEIVLALMHRTARTVAVWRQRSAMREDLFCLDERMLQDIGLTRQQALAEARKPFWRV